MPIFPQLKLKVVDEDFLVSWLINGQVREVARKTAAMLRFTTCTLRNLVCSNMVVTLTQPVLFVNQLYFNQMYILFCTFLFSDFLSLY